MVAGLRVLYPNWKRWPAVADVFVNTRLMPKVASPVLIMHVGPRTPAFGCCHCLQVRGVCDVHNFHEGSSQRMLSRSE